MFEIDLFKITPLDKFKTRDTLFVLEQTILYQLILITKDSNMFEIFQQSRNLEDLMEILESGRIDVRFLGDDYIDKHYTGKGLPIEIKFIDRSHGWSTTKYKISISNSIVSYAIYIVSIIMFFVILVNQFGPYLSL